MAERLFLGIDGGASNITTVILDEQEQVVYQQTSAGGANYHALGLGAAVEHIQEAVQEAVHRLDTAPPIVFDGAVFGLAGCDFETDQETLTQALRRSSLSSMLGKGYQVVNDSRIALRAGTPDGVGVVLIAGTGSNCFGRDGKGKTAKAGGVDYLLSDEGSGYDQGLRILRAVTRALDGRGEPTLLVDLVFESLAVDSLDTLYSVVYTRYTTKPELASLAPLLTRAADQHDQVAQDILNHSANELVKMIDAVLQRLDFDQAVIPVVRVGSVMQEHHYLLNRLTTELRRVAPRATIISPKTPSAVGAALLAKEGLVA